MRHEVFDLLLLANCVYALLRGGAPERLVAATFLVGDLLSAAAVLNHSGRYVGEEYGLFATDVLILVVLVAVALLSTRWWPLFVAALQLNGVLVHLVHLTAPRTLPGAYLNASALWAYPMLFILAIATWRHRRRLASTGKDPSWCRPAFRRAAPGSPSI